MNLTPAQRKTASWLLIAALAIFLIWLLSPVLMPFIVAGVLAYVLRPAVDAMASRRVPRWLAVLLVEVVAVVVLLAVLLLLVPIISKELPLLREQIPLLADRLNQSLSPWLRQFGIQVALDSASIKAFVVKYLDANLEEWLSTALSSARIGGSFLLAIVGNAILIPAVLFYLLMDWPNIMSRLHNLVPLRARAGLDHFLADCDSMLGQYLRGQLMVMGILAIFYSVGLALFGFELAVPVGVFTGLATCVPYLGFGIGLVLALLAAVLQFGTLYGLIGVAVVFGLGQVLESFYLTPRLVGERLGMSPLMVIFALLAFGHLFGFVGVLIALPVCALLSVAAHRLHDAYVNSKLYKG